MLQLGREITILKASEVAGSNGARKGAAALRVTGFDGRYVHVRPIINTNLSMGMYSRDILQTADDEFVIKGLRIDKSAMGPEVERVLIDFVHTAIKGGSSDVYPPYYANSYTIGGQYLWEMQIRVGDEGSILGRFEAATARTRRAEEDGDGAVRIELDKLVDAFGRGTYGSTGANWREGETFIMDDKSYERLHHELHKRENVSPSSMTSLQLFVGREHNINLVQNKGTELYSVVRGRVVDIPFLRYGRGGRLEDRSKSRPARKLLNTYLTDSQKDAWAMARADQAYDNAMLSADQNRCVNAHLSTQLGYVNALGTGDGKTIATLAAFNERMRSLDDVAGPWRGIVVVEASVRDQWRQECEIWLDDGIDVVTVRTRKDAAALKESLDGGRPVLVIVSYSLASDMDSGETALGAVLSNAHFHDAVLDEGLTVRGTGKTARALWNLRENSDVGVVLCATPVLKSVRDLGRLMAWARNDRAIGSKALDATFSTMRTKADVRKWYRWWGPTLLRSTEASKKSTQANLGLEKPAVKPQVISITPSHAELEISNAITGSIRDTLASIVAAYKDTGGSLTPKEERKLRGAVLATSSLARQASSDVRLLRDSTAVGADLLRVDGILDFEDNYVPAKFKWCVDTCESQVKAGNPVVVFTEYRGTALALIDALTAAGMKPAAFIGGGSMKRDEELDAFRSGERDVLVATSAAERGLNLPNARCLIHYDMKFTPDSIFQRSGRITRLAGAGGEVEILFPVTTGTIDERVFSVAVARAGLAGATSAGSVSDFNKSAEGIILKAITPYAKRAALPKNGSVSMLELTQAIVK